MKWAQQVIIELMRWRLQFLYNISPALAARKAFAIFCTPARSRKLKTPRIFEKAETLRISIGNETIFGYRWNAGQPVKILIVHGFSSSSKKFDRYIGSMIGKGYEVLAFDAPAHGQSSGKQITALSYAGALQAIINQYGPMNGIIAHSLGALSTMLVLPQVTDNERIKTVLIAPATNSSSQLKQFLRFMRLPVALYDRINQLIQHKAGLTLEEVAISKVIDQVKGPVYWFHDEEDPITPFRDAIELLEKGYPNVDFYRTRGLGHSRIYRENKVYKKILSSLNFLEDESAYTTGYNN